MLADGGRRTAEWAKMRTAKEIKIMRRIWKQKWLVVIGAVTIFLSIGAVAWAATGSQLATNGVSLSTATTDVTGSGQGPAADRRQAAQERREQRFERQQQLMQLLRGEMTPADQASYDQLVAVAKEKRDALQEARQDLADTLKQLRELTNKYLDAGGAGSGG
jgi:hypothetical protein